MRRRDALKLAAAATITALPGTSRAEDKVVTVGIVLPFTGAASDSADRIRKGAVLAFDEANQKGGVGGYTIRMTILDDGSAATGQYDPALSATDVRKLVIDNNVVAMIGPMNSGSGKAMSAILSQGNLPTISGSSTNPDISSPAFAATYRPAGKPIYFRTVTTDTYQGPNMANYFSAVLKAKRVFILDDSGAYGVGLANAFEAQAKKIGMEVLGHDRLDPLAADYTATLTKIKGLGADSLYCGSSALCGIKIVKQSYDILPTIIKAGGDGFYEPEIPVGAGFPASDDWYATIAAPHLLTGSEMAGWVKRYRDKFGSDPSDYSITAYDGALVIIDALERCAKAGVVTRASMRDAIASAKVNTLQGEVSFDENGDLKSHTISVFQIKHDPAYPPGDVAHQFKYLGVAPETIS